MQQIPLKGIELLTNISLSESRLTDIIHEIHKQKEGNPKVSGAKAVTCTSQDGILLVHYLETPDQAKEALKRKNPGAYLDINSLDSQSIPDAPLGGLEELEMDDGFQPY